MQFSDNIIIADDELLTDDLDVELTNCIIWGSNESELLINNGGGAMVTATLTTNIVRSGEEIGGNFTSQDFNFPGFSNHFSLDFSLDSLSFARDQGTDVGLPLDIRGARRDATPDIGAFEYIDN